jgi:hypothetical protein
VIERYSAVGVLASTVVSMEHLQGYRCLTPKRCETLSHAFESRAGVSCDANWESIKFWASQKSKQVGEPHSEQLTGQECKILEWLDLDVQLARGMLSAGVTWMDFIDLATRIPFREPDGLFGHELRTYASKRRSGLDHYSSLELAQTDDPV